MGSSVSCSVAYSRSSNSWKTFTVPTCADRSLTPVNDHSLTQASSVHVRWRLFFVGPSVGVAVACDEMCQVAVALRFKLRRQARFLFVGGHHVLTLADTFLSPEPSCFCSMQALQDVGAGCRACGPPLAHGCYKHNAGSGTYSGSAVGGGPAGTPMLDGDGKAA